MVKSAFPDFGSRVTMSSCNRRSHVFNLILVFCVPYSLNFLHFSKKRVQVQV